jgi:AcrR family transcriptional regulator
MNKVDGPSRGRRPGQSQTRTEILGVARRRFLADGYDAVTLRSVAAEAGVDVALVSYFFGSKKGLFGAILELPANPPEVLMRAMRGDPATMPERALRALITTWDDPQRGRQLRVMVDAAVREPSLKRLLREVVSREMIDRIAEHIRGPHAQHRAAAFSTQLAGVVFARYVLELEPVTSMTADELVRHLTPGLRAVLHGPRDLPRRP